jgi:hypothetical protein
MIKNMLINSNCLFNIQTFLLAGKYKQKIYEFFQRSIKKASSLVACSNKFKRKRFRNISNRWILSF